jgi:hypothetical protein
VVECVTYARPPKVAVVVVAVAAAAEQGKCSGGGSSGGGGSSSMCPRSTVGTVHSSQPESKDRATAGRTTYSV